MKRAIGRMTRMLRGLQPRQPCAALILMYHRVADLAQDPYDLAVSPQNFAEHLQVVRRLAEPLTIHEMQNRLRARVPAQPYICITFDDGYADNFLNALPALTEAAVPATFFIVSGVVGKTGEFWWDELESIFLNSESRPPQLVLDSLDLRVEDGPSARANALRAVYNVLHEASPDARAHFLEQLRNWAGQAPSARPSHRFMSAAELSDMARNPLVEIGAHTVTHPILARLPEAEQYREVNDSRKQLRDCVGAEVTSFSYPHGTRINYTATTARIVHEAGFTCAASSTPGCVTRSTDAFHLPREVIGNWGADEFEQHLTDWLVPN